jgi:hypothetical protein
MLFNSVPSYKKKAVRGEVPQARGWYCCAVTGESTDQQRLDPYNGLPLVASLDALIDAGLISFESSGEMIVSLQLSSEERHIFGISNKSLMMKPSPETCEYLAYHRDNCVQK